MKYEVRCCCQPQKLVGWLDVPEHMGVFTLPLHSFDYEEQAVRTETIKLVIDVYAPAAICDQDGFYSLPDPYKAIKAEDVPIETLKRIPGFIPNET